MSIEKIETLKKFFVPVDYQSHTDSILTYATSLAEEWNAGIVMFHCFSLPLVSAETSYVQYPMEELYNEDSQTLQRLSDKIKSLTNEKIPVNFISKPGFAAAEILDESKEQKADLIIMSTSKRGKLGQKIVGSNAVYVARHSNIPVLLIPDNYQYKPVKKIILAIDPEHEYEIAIRDKIKRIKDSTNLDFEIITIIHEKNAKATTNKVEVWAKELGIPDEKIHQLKKGTDKIAELLNENSLIGNADMLITFPQKHTIFSRMFAENNTRNLAFNAILPVMAIN